MNLLHDVQREMGRINESVDVMFSPFELSQQSLQILPPNVATIFEDLASHQHAFSQLMSDTEHS